MRHIKDVIAGWTKTQKVAAVVSAIVVIAAGGGCIVYTQYNEPEPVVAETKKEKKPTKEVKEYVTPQGLCISADSLEKDLNIYFTDDAGEKITDVTFGVKIARVGDADDASRAVVESYQAPVDEFINSYINADQETNEGEDNQTEITDNSVDTNVEAATEEAAEGLEKNKYQSYLKEYQRILDGVDGEVYTDDDKDGLIYLQGIEPGYYVVWTTPLDGYLPTKPMIGAEVKDKVEYKPVENIEKKVVTYNAAADVTPHANVVQEAPIVNSTGFVESRKETIPAQYSTASAVVATGVSGEPVVVSDNSIDLCTVANSQVKLYAKPNLNSTSVAITNINTANGAGIADVRSSNAGIAMASYDGVGNINVTAVAPGRATISVDVTYSAGRVIKDVVTVNVGDSSEVLKDAAGNELYLDNKGQTKATIADYDASRTYYYCSQQQSYKYYGWQTIDGERYYYDANGNYVTGEQTIAGVMYTFSSDGKLVQSLGAGIDVSKWQGNIDWPKVRASGINFAIIRAGGRYRDGRTLYKDPYFEKNMKGATAAGIKVGVYFYSTALTEAEAVEEASLAASMCRGYSMSLPIFIDMEDSIQASLTTAERTAIATAFCETVKSSGYTAGVYANYNWWTTKLNASALSKYRVWIARYNSTLGYSGKCDIWQYSSEGTVPGINGHVDVNIAYY